MSTLKVDALTTKSDNADLTITGGGTGVPNLETGYKVNGTVEKLTGIAPSTSGNVLTSDGTDWTSAAAGGGPSQATQAALEAETNEDTYAPPDLIKHSPGVAKFWCNFNGGLSGPISPTADYNVVDITDNGTGDYTVNISTDFSTADWCVVALCRGGGTNVNDRFLVNIYTTSSPMTAGTIRLFLIRVRGAGSANSTENSSLMSVAGFGDQ